jgi:hypothetical protein
MSKLHASGYTGPCVHEEDLKSLASIERKPVTRWRNMLQEIPTRSGAITVKHIGDATHIQRACRHHCRCLIVLAPKKSRAPANG